METFKYFKYLNNYMTLNYNPFNDSGIVNYEQFKQYPFLVFGVSETIKNRIEEQIKQIKNNYIFGERLILIGERGIGKTSALFFIHDLLKKNNLQSILFSRLIEDAEHFATLCGERMGIISDKPIYLLVDFPDSVDMKQFKKFLEFLWSIMIHKNYNKINLIFSMNISHFEKSFSYSEILGKFITLRLEKLDFENTTQLINSRLKLVNKDVKNVFNPEVIESVYTYSKGIPRNIISACSLLVSNSNGDIIEKSKAESILKEKYTEQVINDRVEDLELRRIYKIMVSVLQNEFLGTAKSQEDYVKKIREVTQIGRNSILARINDLTKFGIFKQYKGGYNRVNKILSLN